MKARRAAARVVPEVDRKRAVREVEIERAAGRENAQQSGQKRAPRGVAIRQRLDAICIAAHLLDAYVLEDARAEEDVKVRIGERQLRTVSDREAFAMDALAPLPPPQRGGVDAVRIVTGGGEEIDGD